MIGLFRANVCVLFMTYGASLWYRALKIYIWVFSSTVFWNKCCNTTDQGM